MSDRLTGGVMFTTMCAATLLLSGCAAPKSYMGIDLTGPVYPARGEAIVQDGKASEPSDPLRAMPAPTIYSYAASTKNLPLKALARQAQAGVKAAQLELGIRFEEGRGVERDLCKAALLYDLAKQKEHLPNVRVTTFAGNSPASRSSTTISRDGAEGSLEAARRSHKLRNGNLLANCGGLR